MSGHAVEVSKSRLSWWTSFSPPWVPQNCVVLQMRIPAGSHPVRTLQLGKRPGDTSVVVRAGVQAAEEKLIELKPTWRELRWGLNPTTFAKIDPYLHQKQFLQLAVSQCTVVLVWVYAPAGAPAIGNLSRIVLESAGHSAVLILLCPTWLMQ